MLLGQFQHHCFAVKHGCSAFSLHKKSAIFSHPVLWPEGVPGTKIHQRLSAQYGNSVL
jgi:hypothetical protein